MRIEQLQYVLEVAHCQSMSKAAKKLYISQPALTNSINCFEEEIGFKVFHRSANGTIPTVLGEHVLEVIQGIMAGFNEIEYISEKQKEMKNDLHIAAIPAVCNSAIADIICCFKATFPNTTIYVNEVRPENIVNSLKQNNYALGIFSSINGFEQVALDELTKHRYSVEKIYDDEMAIFASTHSPLLKLESVTTKEVAAQYETVNQIIELLSLKHYRNHPQLSELMLNSAYNFSDRENVKKFVAKDLAIAVLPLSFAKDDLYVNSKLITPLKVTDLDLPITGYLAYAVTNMTPQVSALINCIKEYYAPAKA